VTVGSDAGPTRSLLVLVGPPGVGKTTVGRMLAEHWSVPFCDTDDVVSQRAGRSVGDLFIMSGESEFRLLERLAVADALATFTGVLALGGGAVADSDTRRLLIGHRVVFLDVGLADAARRVGLNRDRPLLLGNIRGQWVDLMTARRPWYEQVATATVGTDGLTPQQVTAKVLAALDEAAAPASPAGDPR